MPLESCKRAASRGGDSSRLLTKHGNSCLVCPSGDGRLHRQMEFTSTDGKEGYRFPRGSRHYMEGVEYRPGLATDNGLDPYTLRTCN